MEATAWERAAILAEAMASANREPREARDVLGACAHGGRRACGARGALVRHTPHGRATGRAEGTSAVLRELEEQALTWGEGPGEDAATSGRALMDVDLRAPSVRRRWPRWAPRAARLGFDRVRALPLVECGRPVGALVLFDAADETRSGPVGAWSRALCQVTAHALSLQRQLRESRTLVDLRNRELSDRVVVEQAKGVIAGRHGLSVDEACARLREHAGAHGREPADVARDIVAGLLDVGRPGAREAGAPAVNAGFRQVRIAGSLTPACPFST